MGRVEPVGAPECGGPQMIFAGSPFCDVILTGMSNLPGPGEESWATGRLVSAGGSANRAVAAARLGVRTALVGSLGTDAFGRIVAELLAVEERVDCRWLCSDPEWQTPVSISVTDGTDRRFLSSGERGAAPNSVHRLGDLPAARYVEVGVVQQQPDWIDQQRSRGAVIVGEAARTVGQDRSEEVLRGLTSLDVLMINADEACEYSRTQRIEEAARFLAGYVPLVVVTIGTDGAIAVDAHEDRPIAVEAIPVRAIDTTGAGDVFTAAYLTADLVGLDLDERLRFASVAAGLSVERIGGAAGSPRASDLLDWAASDRGRVAPRHADAVQCVLERVTSGEPA